MGSVKLYDDQEVPLFSWRSYRLFLLVLLLVLFTLTSAIFMNVGFSVVCMVNVTAAEDARNTAAAPPTLLPAECRSRIGNKTQLGYRGTLNWSTIQQSQLFAIAFYASFATVGVSGVVSDRFSPKALIVAAALVYSLLALLTPSLIHTSYFAFLIDRALQGLAEGFMFPSLTANICRWIPPAERSSAAAIYSSGHQLGALLSVVISAQFCSLDFLGGWPLIWYTLGAGTLLAAAAVWFFVSSGPSENRFIGDQERRYLELTLAHQGLESKTKRVVPWFSILTSPAVYAIMICEGSYYFTNTLTNSYLPSYFRDVMAFDMNQNGLYAALPLATQIIFKVLISTAADSLRMRYNLSATACCKFIQTFTTLGTALIIVCMALFLDCTRHYLAVVIVALFGVCFSCQIAGAFTATLFLAPPYTGTLSSVTALVGAIGGMLAPTVVGLLNKTGSIEEWSHVFYVTASINIFAGCFFLCFGSAELQPWALDTEKLVNTRTEIVTKSRALSDTRIRLA